MVAVAAAAVACTSNDPSRGQATYSSGASDAASRCDVTTGPLPTWARAGFSPPAVSVPYVLGTRGDIVGVLFGNPLHSPPRRHRANKILWVARVDTQGGALEIRARLHGADRVVSRKVEGGPGPSIIDMPAAGCWTFTLSWSGRTDQVSVRYQPH